MHLPIITICLSKCTVLNIVMCVQMHKTAGLEEMTLINRTAM